MSYHFRYKITAFLGRTESIAQQNVLANISSSDWDRQMGWLDRSGLALPLLSVLRERNLTRLLPARTVIALEQRSDDNRLRMLDMLGRFSQVVAVLMQRRISFVCVKGFSLFPEYLAQIEDRHQSDFDFLVAPEHMDAAEECLLHLGYRLNVRDVSGERRFSTPGSIAVDKDAYLYHLQNSCAVELHPYFWENEEKGVPLCFPLFEWTQNLETHEIEGVRFPRLRPVYQLTYQLMHYFRHLSGTWARMLWLYEVSRFVSSHKEEGHLWRDAIALWSRDAKIEQVCRLVLHLASRTFSVALPEQIENSGCDWAECRLWVDHFSHISLYADLPGNKASLLFLEPFFENVSAYRNYVWQRLLPVRSGHSLNERLSAAGKSAWRYRLRNMWYQVSRLVYHLRSSLVYITLDLRWRRAFHFERLFRKKRRRSFSIDRNQFPGVSK